VNPAGDVTEPSGSAAMAEVIGGQDSRRRSLV